MNGPAWVLLGMAFVLAALDWVAVARRRTWLEYLCSRAPHWRFSERP